MKALSVFSLLLTLLGTSFVFAASAVTAEPVLPGLEGQSAFDDLGELYRDHEKVPDYQGAIDDLGSPEAETREFAGRYLHALFAQSFADESNGRSKEWSNPPFWCHDNGSSQAFDFREKLAETFGEEAKGVEALSAVAWLLEEEVDAAMLEYAIPVVERIKGDESDSLVRKHIRDLHPNGAVATSFIDLASERGLEDLGDDLLGLQHYPRESVRKAARRAVMGFDRSQNLVDFEPIEAVKSDPVKRLFSAVAKMQRVKIPEGAKWCRFVYTHPGSKRDGKHVEIPYSGWLLDEDGDEFRFLDSFAREWTLAKEDTVKTESALAEEVERIIAVREGNLREPHRFNDISEGFGPPFVTIPELLVSLVSMDRDDFATAASLILPCYDAAADDRHLVWAARNLFGHRHHQNMLDAFAWDRDFPAAIEYSQHLFQPVFDGYLYQNRSKELVEQLQQRDSDFKTFVLPTPRSWKHMTFNKSRMDQIEFLAERLRLINFRNHGFFKDRQYVQADPRIPAPGVSNPVRVINPYNELLEMELNIDELPSLIPFLNDQNFLVAYTRWRSFAPWHTMYRVNGAVAKVINEVAQQEIVDAEELDNLDEEARAERLTELVKWCEENAGRDAE